MHKTKTGETKADIVILREYFGIRPGQTVLDFAKEVKELSLESKEELALGAARELGYTLVS